MNFNTILKEERPTKSISLNFICTLVWKLKLLCYGRNDRKKTSVFFLGTVKGDTLHWITRTYSDVIKIMKFI